MRKNTHIEMIQKNYNGCQINIDSRCLADELLIHQNLMVLIDLKCRETYFFSVTFHFLDMAGLKRVRG
jgi:hypothetical protein